MQEILSLTSFVVDFDIKKNLKQELQNYKNILVIAGVTAFAKFKDKLEYAISGNYHLTHTKECSFNDINKIINECKGLEFDLVLAIGGGKVLDTSKYIANAFNLKIITIPTIAATCAAVSALSVIYEDEKFKELALFKEPPFKCFIDLETIKNAPKRYLIAGIGDTMAKFYEFDLQLKYAKANNIGVNYSNSFGKICSNLCVDLNYEYAKSLNDNLSFKNVVMSIIVNTGYVSRSINIEYNGAFAHATCYAISYIKEIEKNFLHGELVAFGILVQLLIEKKYDEYEKLLKFYKEINLPTKISDFIKEDEFLKHIDKIASLVLASSDVINLINRGFITNLDEIKNALIYKKERE